MTVTLDNLIHAARTRLGDHVQEGYDVATGDGETDRFSLSHTNLLESSCSILVGGAPDLTASVDEASGWVRFTAIPAAEAEISFSYQYTVWSDERITEALNAAIDERFGQFYVDGFNDTLVSAGETEFVAQTSAAVDLDPEDRITRVEFWSGTRWMKTERWKVAVQGAHKVIVLETTPAIGTQLRISYHSRPGNLVGTSDTLETTVGIKAYFAEPLVLLACSDLIVDRLHHRIRDDRGHNTQAENPVKSYEIQNDAQFLRAQADLKLSRMKMPPLRSRATF